jgi:GTP-binding protein Era
LVGTNVFLELFVKVQPGWRESRQFVEELDWRRQLEHIAGPARPDSGPAEFQRPSAIKAKV